MNIKQNWGHGRVTMKNKKTMGGKYVQCNLFYK